MTTTAESLSGPWAANVRGWLWTALPASLLVVMQELSTALVQESAGMPWMLHVTTASVVLQLAASAAWGAAVAGVSRQVWGRVVPVASGILWVGLGVVRGVVGGAVAVGAGIDPEWAYRIGFWTLVSVIWMPWLTYALAQWDEHRRLLALRADIGAAHALVAERAAETAETRARRAAEAIDDALGPALDEVRAGLRENAGALGHGSVGAIVARLDDLADRAAGFTVAGAVPPLPRTAGRVSVVGASRDFELRRPVLAAFLTAVTIAPLILPDAFRAGGWSHLAEAIAAIVVASAVLIGAFAVLRPQRFTSRQRLSLGRVGVGGAGLAGAAMFVLAPWEPFGTSDVVAVALFPLLFAIAASTVATAVALHATNVELVARTAAEQAGLDDLTTRIRAIDASTSTRLETLVQGELSGRLAACAMALGFLATGDLTVADRDDVIAGVLTQLDRAAAELRAIEG